MKMWIVLVEALLGGLALAVVGGLVFYYASLLFLALVSALLPLAGGKPKWLSREKLREDR